MSIYPQTVENKRASFYLEATKYIFINLYLHVKLTNDFELKTQTKRASKH